MKPTDEQMTEWSDNRFQGLTKDQLIAAGEVLGCTFDRRNAEKSMRTSLCEKIGLASLDEPETIIEAMIPQVAKRDGISFDPKPHLLPGARWGGKRHSLRVNRPNLESEHSQNYFSLTWEGYKLAWEYDLDLSMPHPYYEILKGSIKRHIVQKQIRDDEGFQTGVQNIEHENKRFNFQYNGFVPGTENLPESLLDYWKRQAAKHNNFRTQDGKPFKRRVLRNIRSDLYGPVGEAYYKDVTDEDILYSILLFLHGDEADELAA